MKWLKLVAAYLAGFALLILWRMSREGTLDWSDLNWNDWGWIAFMALPFTLLGQFVNSPLWSRLLSPSSPLTLDGFVTLLWTNPLAKRIEQSSSPKRLSLLRMAYAFLVLLSCFTLVGFLAYLLQ